MRYEELSPELQKKVASCKTTQEVIALAEECGHELTDDELDQIDVAGGAWGGTSGTCPNCGSTSYHTTSTGTVNQRNVCNKCGCEWG